MQCFGEFDDVCFFFVCVGPRGQIRSAVSTQPSRPTSLNMFGDFIFIVVHKRGPFWGTDISFRACILTKICFREL